MSHGSTDNKCEPNFVPLLDLVLQLIMFFMLCTNFVMEQTSDEVNLPQAVSARDLEKLHDEVIYLNVNARGQLILPPSEVRAGDPATLDNAAQVEAYMLRRAAVEKEKTKKPRPEATIIMRIDKETPFGLSYPIIKACRTAGYTNVQLRAIQYTGEDQ